MLRAFWEDSRGLSAMEYGLVVALMVGTVVVILRPMSEMVRTAMEDAWAGIEARGDVGGR